MNKAVYLDLSVLGIIKTVIYEFWYDYMKLKYNKKAKLCYKTTYSFIVHVKVENNYKDIAKAVEKMFDTLNHELERSLPKRKEKQKTNDLIKSQLGGKMIKEIVRSRSK